MLRLRTTTGLSVLALAIGIAGTGWLSTLTAGWHGPTSRVATVKPARHALPARTRWHVPVSVGRPHRTLPHRADDAVQAAALAYPSKPELVPLAAPRNPSPPWAALRGHLDGQVLLHVDVDGSGRVSAARLAVSSGDPVLDEHALRSARGWRFAVPADHPDGFSGELPMRCVSRAASR